jgi:bacillithiol system protein YtxJ
MRFTLQTSYFCAYAYAQNLSCGPSYCSSRGIHGLMQVGRYVSSIHRIGRADRRSCGSGMSLVPVTSLDDIHRLGRYRGGILVFKHSTRCSISTAAHHRVQTWLAAHPDAEVGYVDVIAQRPLSNELAKVWLVEHQSPQLLWFREDGSVLHQSHFGIDAGWIDSLN